MKNKFENAGVYSDPKGDRAKTTPTGQNYGAAKTPEPPTGMSKKETSGTRCGEFPLLKKTGKSPETGLADAKTGSTT